MRYRVACDCYGFMGAFWNKDQIADIADGIEVPHHFVPITPATEIIPEKVAELNTFSELTAQHMDNIKIPGLAEVIPEPVKQIDVEIPEAAAPVVDAAPVVEDPAVDPAPAAIIADNPELTIAKRSHKKK